MTTTAYRSTHPTVLAAWQAAQQRAEEIGRQRKALLGELGERRLRVNGLRVVGKKLSGRELDGREWSEFPGAVVGRG